MLWIKMILLMLVIALSIWNWRQIEILKTNKIEYKEYRYLADWIDNAEITLRELEQGEGIMQAKEVYESINQLINTWQCKLNKALNDSGTALRKVNALYPNEKKKVDACENVKRNGKLADKTFKESMKTYDEALQKQEARKVEFPKEPNDMGLHKDLDLKYQQKLEEVKDKFNTTQIPTFADAEKEIGDDTEEIQAFFERKKEE